LRSKNPPESVAADRLVELVPEPYSVLDVVEPPADRCDDREELPVEDPPVDWSVLVVVSETVALIVPPPVGESSPVVWDASLVVSVPPVVREPSPVVSLSLVVLVDDCAEAAERP